MTLLFELKGVSFQYLHRPLLFSSLDFQVARGEKIALLGSNGAGKTTLLHLMMGLLKPLSGDIYAFGRHRREEKDFIEVRGKAGLLFQDPDDMLFCPTVIEDVAFGPLNQGLSKNEAVTLSQQVLADLGMAGYAQRITHQLSGGEKRMITLAAVLAMRPEVLLLDEPTNGLDVRAKERLLGVLKKLQQAMVLISHEEQVVNALAGRHYRLSDTF